MALEIVTYGDPILKRIAKPLEEIDDAVRERARELIELMYRDRGVGLAAPQVGRGPAPLGADRVRMRIHRDLNALKPEQFRAPAVTLGVFDGVHEGHRAIFRELEAAARRTGGEKVVVTFDRHPRAVITGEAPPAITSLEHRLVLFERAGIDAAVVLRFDGALAARTAEEFLRDVLVRGVGARAIVLGEDSHFG